MILPEYINNYLHKVSFHFSMVKENGGNFESNYFDIEYKYGDIPLIDKKIILDFFENYISEKFFNYIYPIELQNKFKNLDCYIDIQNPNEISLNTEITSEGKWEERIKIEL